MKKETEYFTIFIEFPKVISFIMATNLNILFLYISISLCGLVCASANSKESFFPKKANFPDRISEF